MPELIVGDCLAWLREAPPQSVDLVFGSPPYEDARTYGVDFNLRGEQWVEWMGTRMLEMAEVCKGLVAMVVEGRTRNYQWSATPALLMAYLHQRGLKLRKPPIFRRVGIPGSGGPDWLRSDYEFIVCCSHGKLPWSDNTACGEPPKWRLGGGLSYRAQDGTRMKGGKKPLPAKSNPGNIIKCTVGGGHMGSPLAHKNEAPFPLTLAEFFVRSFCPPGGVVLDPFCGSGTTGHAALNWGREFIGIDIRKDQIELTRKRLCLAEVLQ